MKIKPIIGLGWCFIVLGVLASVKISAQSANTPKEKWRFLVEPYLLFPNMQGTVGLGTLPDADVDEDPGDIFSNLQIGAMLYLEAAKGNWTISSDFTYMKLESDIVGKNGIISGNAEVSQLAWEVAGLYKLKPWLDAGIAVQLNNIKSDLVLILNIPGSPLSRVKSLNESWVDPSFVARIKVPLSANNKWGFQFRGNIGGFGIGSDLYWQMQTYFSYRFSKLFQLQAGYRYIDFDYENGSGEDRFKYDMATFGPVIRFGFNF